MYDTLGQVLRPGDLFMYGSGRGGMSLAVLTETLPRKDDARWDNTKRIKYKQYSHRWDADTGYHNVILKGGLTVSSVKLKITPHMLQENLSERNIQYLDLWADVNKELGNII